MPLSEHEQRMLDEIESALYAEDPKFASTVRKTRGPGPGKPTALVVVLGIVGVALLVGGLALDFKPGGFPVLSLVGFLLMFAAGVLALRSAPAAGPRPVGGSGGKGPGGGRGPGGGKGPGGGRPSPKPGTGGSYSSRMEDRFRKRFEQ